MWSFSETKAQGLIAANPVGMVKANREQLSRIYPSSLRVRSSNFNPVYFWNAGCQLGEFCANVYVRPLKNRFD